MKLFLAICLTILIASLFLFTSPLLESKAIEGGYEYGYSRIQELERAHELDMQKIQDLNDGLNLAEVEIAKLHEQLNILKDFIEGPDRITIDTWIEVLGLETH